jgi:hypothetical protein
MILKQNETAFLLKMILKQNETAINLYNKAQVKWKVSKYKTSKYDNDKEWNFFEILCSCQQMYRCTSEHQTVGHF